MDTELEHQLRLNWFSYPHKERKKILQSKLYDREVCFLSRKKANGAKTTVAKACRYTTNT